MTKTLFIKTKVATIASALMFTSVNVNALGLGTLDVQSNLDQPLDAYIELRINSGDDIDSVKASIASRADFANLGIDYPSYLDNINVTLDRAFGTPQLRIDSNDFIVKEPFIHFLVRVDWSGGSFLREYTALIDPPIYASEAPKSISAPRIVNTTPFQQEPSYAPTTSSTRNFNSSPRATQSTFTSPTDARYGPVEAGETLSMVAEQLQSQYPDLSIYQIMKVLFEQNRRAFIDGNINGLIKGSILDIGDINAIRAVDIRDGKQFFAEQAADWSGQVTASDDVKIAQDQYNDSEDSILETINESVGENFQVGASTDTDSLISDSDSDTSNGEVIVLKRQVSELQSSLSSGAQENQDLKERISILEAQLADMQDLVSLGVDVENSSLASLEQSLAQANDAVEQETSDLIESVDEVTDNSVDLANDALAEFTKDAEETIAATGDDLLESGDVDTQTPLIGEDVAITDDSLNDPLELSAVESVETSKPAPIVVNKPEPSFFEKAKTALFEGGIWKLIAGLGGVILAGVLAVFFIRRHRADEEFEISMLSIESNSQSVNSIDDPMLSRSMSASVTASVSQVDGAEESQETSFLTVYSDSDAVVQADEVDPIAEADVYIAYGRHEQAEEVLLDGVANYPDRIDIKHKLLTVYHKNTNTEGFERIAEELYSNRDTLEPNVWQEICEMGKDINPENPLFELSAEDIETASVVVGSSEDEALAETNDSDDEILADISDVSDNEDISFEDDDLINLDVAEDIAFDTQALDSLEVDETAISDDDLDVSELDIADADDESVQLINFNEGRSEISELDEVAISTLEFDTPAQNSEEASHDDEINIDVEDDIVEDDGLELDIELDDELASDIDLDSDLAFEDVLADLDSDDDSEPNVGALSELSDLEVDDDYDELRTQYELAKVFSDLGDEDGARKILTDIIADDSADDALVQESKELLESFS